MRSPLTDERGFVTILILMLTAALLILVAVAMKSMYTAHSRNREDKETIIKRAERLSAQNSDTVPNSVRLKPDLIE